MFHADDCWCPTCKRFRARLEALEAELTEARHSLAVLEEALGIDTSPPTEEELAYARQLAAAGR